MAEDEARRQRLSAAERLYEQAAAEFAAVADDEVRERVAAAARLYEHAADELERAMAHCRRASEHFRNHDVPRAAAHAWAARGHIVEASDRLDEQAREHRLRARI